MRVLVSGGSGFIGTNLVARLLQDGHTVVNLDVRKPPIGGHFTAWTKVDIHDSARLVQLVTEFKPQVVYHLAARTDLPRNATVADYATNVQGVKNMIDAIARCGLVERTVFTSSRLVFRVGHRPVSPYDYAPNTAYGESKALGEELVRSRSDDLNAAWVLVRPTSIWGPWFDVPYRDFFLSIYRERYVNPGRARPRKSFGYVGNSVHQLLAVGMQLPYGAVGNGPFWIADYEPIDVYDWARLIARELKRRPPRTFPLSALRLASLIGDAAGALGFAAPITSFRLRNLLSDMVYDTSATERVAGPLPYDVEAGVIETVKWILQSS